MHARDCQGGRGFAIGEEVVFDVLNDRLVRVGRYDHQVRLTPVAARLLRLFVDTPQTVVRRRQLLDQNWRAYGMEVCENSLNQTIHALREAFQEISPEHLYIKTIPRIGYALVVDVQPVQPSSAAWGVFNHGDNLGASSYTEGTGPVCHAMA